MAHHRKLIRAAIVEKLKSKLPSPGDRVFPSRAAPIYKQSSRAILVYTKEEPAQVSIEAPREYERGLVVQLELVASSENEMLLDDVLDDFAEQVEAAIFEDETHGGLVSDTILGDTEIELLSEGEKPIGDLKVSLTMPYHQELFSAAAPHAACAGDRRHDHPGHRPEGPVSRAARSCRKFEGELDHKSEASEARAFWSATRRASSSCRPTGASGRPASTDLLERAGFRAAT
jgi:hypothetical protein